MYVYNIYIHVKYMYIYYIHIKYERGICNKLNCSYRNLTNRNEIKYVYTSMYVYRNDQNMEQ